MSNDDTQPVSGSRWEPVAQPPAPPGVQPAPMPAAAPPVAYAPAPPPKNRGRLLLAGGAVGIALVAGAGGFALGHATADDGNDRFGGPGFRQNGFPDNGQVPPGFQNGPGGAMPGPDGDDDRPSGGPTDGFPPDGGSDGGSDGGTQGSSTT